MNVEHLLNVFPGFQSLSDADRDKIVTQGEFVRAFRGQSLFQKGTACQSLDLLLSGSVRVFIPGGKGREILLYRVEPGQLCILSCSCLLGQTVYPASSLAETDVAAIRLSQALFEHLIEYQPFRAQVFRLFSDRLQSLLALVEAVTFQKLEQRLAALLLSKGETIHATHQQLADELGSVREMISRLLRQFEERGWLQLGRERIRIYDRTALEQLAND